jgi:hypothetical protein
VLALRVAAWVLRVATSWPVLAFAAPCLLVKLPLLLGSLLTWLLTEKVLHHKLAFGRIFLWPVSVPSPRCNHCTPAPQHQPTRDG